MDFSIFKSTYDVVRFLITWDFCFLDAKIGAVCQSLHHAGIFYASIVWLWIVKNVLLVTVGKIMRCKLLKNWHALKTLIPSGLSPRI